MTLPRLFTRDELREYLGGISSSTLARWIDDGKIPGPLSGTTRWDRAAVDRALDRASGLTQPQSGSGEWRGAFNDDRAA